MRAVRAWQKQELIYYKEEKNDEDDAEKKAAKMLDDFKNFSKNYIFNQIASGLTGKISKQALFSAHLKSAKINVKKESHEEKAQKHIEKEVI